MGATPDSMYIDRLTNKIVALEKLIESDVEFVNHPVNGRIAVKFANGDSYEFFNYQDPMRDKPKRPGYKPPEIEYKKLVENIKEDAPESGEFGIFKFCICVMVFGLIALDVIIVWIILTQLR